MHTKRVIPAAIMLLSAAGCGESGPSGSFTLEVTPLTSSLFTAAPGNTVELAVATRDEAGTVVAGGIRSFTTSAPGVATVTDAGTVTAVGVGTAEITTAVTMNDVTKTAVTAVTVQAAPAAETVTAPALSFTPEEVDVQLGGVVTWTMADVPHTVAFTGAGAPADLPQLQNTSGSRTFTVSGTYPYRCTLHPSMSGEVRVH